MSVRPIDPTIAALVLAKYDGQLDQNGACDGEGNAEFKDGTVYRGQWAAGRMHGRGFFEWPDKTRYEGDLQQGSITGKGKYLFPDGSMYEGDVLNGLRHGYGVLYNPQLHCLYEGNWENGSRHGDGTLFYDEKKKTYYKGRWVTGKRHGWGVMSYASGNEYRGQWQNDLKDGQGIMVWRTTSQRYEGTWANDQPHGQGVYTWDDIAGLKSQGKEQGSVTHLQAANRYEGQMQNGKRHGDGTFMYASGATYVGQWMDNYKHGLGVFEFENGRVYRGRFEHDRMVDLPPVDALPVPAGARPPQTSNLAPPRRGSAASSDQAAADKAAGKVDGALFTTTGLNMYLATTTDGTFDLPVEDLVFEYDDGDAEREKVNRVLLRFNSELRSIYRFYSRQSAAGASQRPSGHSAAFHTAAAAIKAVHEHLGYMSSNNNNSDNQTAELSAHEIRASRLAQQAQLTLRLRGLWAMARDCQLLNSTLSLAKFNELIHPPRKVYPADATAKQIRAAASAAVLSSALQQQQQQQEVTPTKTKPNSKPGTADKIAASANRSGATTPLPQRSAAGSRISQVAQRQSSLPPPSEEDSLPLAYPENIHDGDEVILMRGFLEALVRLAHSTGDASKPVSVRLLVMLKDTVLPKARTEESTVAPVVSAFAREFSSDAVRDKIHQHQSLLHALFARYAGVPLPTVGQKTVDLSDVVARHVLNIRAIVKIFSDFEIKSEHLPSSMVIKAMAGLMESNEDEMQYLDSDILYDQFVEGMVRCADQCFLMAVDTPPVVVTESVAAEAAPAEATEPAAPASEAVEGQQAADAEPKKEVAPPMPLDRKFAQFCLMFARAGQSQPL